MKKIVLLLMSFTLMCTSCKDFLNMPPKNVKVVYTMEDVRQTMSTYLFAITKSSEGYTVSNYIMFNGSIIQFPFTRHINVVATMLTNDLDMTIFPDEEGNNPNRGGRSFSKDYAGAKKWDSNELASRVWVQVFNNVGYLNMVLKDLESAPDFDQTIFDRVSGEARVARAYYLLQLNQLFAPVDRNDLGIPFNLDADIIQGGERWSQKELYKKLIGEIKDVMEYKTVPKDTWNIFYNRRVMCAILAQTYRYKACTCAAEPTDWGNAEKYAKEARNDAKVATTSEEIFELATVPYDEVVDKPHRFALLRIALYASGPNDFSPWGMPEQKLYQSPSDDLYSLYDDNDLRKDIYFRKSEDKVNVSRIEMTDENHYINDTHVLFSFAELQLIEAEAAANLGNNAKALELLNDFKKSRISDYAGYSGNDVVKEIYNERRKEFAYEGFSNWVDMKLRNEKIVRKAFDEVKNGIEVYTLEQNDYRYTLPIPGDVELKYNNVPQNPGWK